MCASIKLHSLLALPGYSVCVTDCIQRLERRREREKRDRDREEREKREKEKERERERKFFGGEGREKILVAMRPRLHSVCSVVLGVYDVFS